MSESPSAFPAFGIVGRDVLPERISARLLSMIAEKQLQPGDKLPPERELAATMGVSRPALREALRALAMMNVVEIRQGSGTHVTSLRPERLVEHLDFVFALDDSTFVELLEARRVIEPGIAALAAERATDAELQELRTTLERTAAAIGDDAGFLEADVHLHSLITTAARNPILARFMASLTRLGLASRARTVTLPGVQAQTLRDHRAIIAAISSRDPEAAADVMRRHLEQIQARLSQSLAST